MFMQNLNFPNCGGPIQMDVNNPLAVCTYCHSTIRGIPKPMGIPAESADGIRLTEIAQALNRMLLRMPLSYLKSAQTGNLFSVLDRLTVLYF